VDGSARTLDLRLRSQGLSGTRATGVEAIAARLVGVQAQDLAAWSGIGLRRARRGLEQIASELREAGDGSGAMLSSARGGERPAASPHVALLGHFEPYLLGYATRDLVLDPRFATRIQAGGGFVAPAIHVDGRVAGTWRRGQPERLEPFVPLAGDVLAALEREHADVDRFLTAAP
jgi:hypothetical protein